MALRLDRQGVKRAIFAALGLAGCGPAVATEDGSGDADGSGSESATTGSTVSSSSSTMTTLDTTGAMTTVGTSTVGTSTTDTGDTTGEPPSGCNVPPPPGVFPAPCEDPQQIPQDGEDGPVQSGLESCADARVHRYAQLACQYPASVVGDCGGVPGGSCESDADCTDAPHGYCNSLGDLGCGCEYGCEADADCGEDELCYCDGSRSRCVPATCTHDGDCGGWYCLRGFEPSVCGPARPYFACGSPFDACVAGSDGCDELACEACTWAADECRWACAPNDDVCSDCGRPYLVDGDARRATAIMRDDWAAELEPGALELDAGARKLVAAHWQRAALAEHASVAAFARYTLDLLALAAPPELVAAASTAMADELEHARLCFGLVARYGGGDRGPGPLSSEGALGHRDALRILDDVVREACIGETLAALEAIEALAQATDPVVRTVLERIADDELRHAQLGWRHLRWALEHADASTREAIIDIFDAALADALFAPVVGAADGSLTWHGVLDAESRVRARHGGLLEIVRPCAAAALRAAATQPAIAVA